MLGFQVKYISNILSKLGQGFYTPLAACYHVDYSTEHLLILLVVLMLRKRRKSDLEENKKPGKRSAEVSVQRTIS